MAIPAARTKALIQAGAEALHAYQDLAQAIAAEVTAAKSTEAAAASLMVLLGLSGSLAPSTATIQTLATEAAWWKARHVANARSAQRMAQRRTRARLATQPPEESPL